MSGRIVNDIFFLIILLITKCSVDLKGFSVSNLLQISCILHFRVIIRSGNTKLNIQQSTYKKNYRSDMHGLQDSFENVHDKYEYANVARNSLLVNYVKFPKVLI